MNYCLQTFLLVCTICVFGQTPTTDSFEVRHIEYYYKSDKVDIVIKSKKGEENIKKPLFIFCQGSLPQPLLKHDANGIYGIFPFNPDNLAINYHLIIIGKPFIPLMAHCEELGPNFTVIDNTGQFPKQYSVRNHLDYYVERNIEIIKYLQKQNWVSKKQLIIAGHSEGSTIAAKIASSSSLVSKLIYSGGNPMGRIMSVIQQNRYKETSTESKQFAEDDFNYWQYVVKDNNSSDASLGDTNKTMYDFSKPPIEYLEKLKIPVLVCYGTKDWSAPFNDFLRVDCIRKGKQNFTFKPYIGVEHNYFPLKEDSQPNYDIFNWDNVANDWLKWLAQTR